MEATIQGFGIRDRKGNLDNIMRSVESTIGP